MTRLINKSLAVLIAAPVDDILVLRRLLRDTSYRVDPATSATQALRAITMHAYNAVIADDEALVGIAGSKMLSSVEELQPTALRVLIARRDRRPQLANAALQKKYPAVRAPVLRGAGARRAASPTSARRRWRRGCAATTSRRRQMLEAETPSRTRWCRVARWRAVACC